MKQVLRIYLQVFLTKVGVDSIPYSRILLAMLGTLLVVVKTLGLYWLIKLADQLDNSIAIELSLASSLLIAGLWLMILVACLNYLLGYYQVSERRVQVLSAVIGFDLLVNIIFILWLGVFSHFRPELTQLPLISGFLFMSYILLIYWQIVTYTHIFASSLPIKTLIAGVYAVVYMLLQYNVTELLLNLVAELK